MNKLSGFFTIFTAIVILSSTLSLAQAEAEEKLTYTIISDKNYQSIRRSIDIRLDKKISEEALRKIALGLKERDKIKHERTFIAYYLPDMKVWLWSLGNNTFRP